MVHVMSGFRLVLKWCPPKIVPSQLKASGAKIPGIVTTIDHLGMSQNQGRQTASNWQFVKNYYSSLPSNS